MCSTLPKFLSEFESLDMHDLDYALEMYPVSLPGWSITSLLHMTDHAVLYLAKNNKNKRAVIKRFNYSITHLQDTQIHDFIESVDSIRAIGFGGLVDIYHTGLSSDAFYLLMEYLDNGDLAQIITMAPEEVSLEKKLDWFEDIVIAVGTLHNADLLHRDLKPSNIMFRDNNELVLVDCGIESEWLITSGYLSAGEVYCTPSYVSPERAAGNPCDVQTEIYSLGVMFYELIMGKKPYEANNMLGLMKRHALAPIPELSNEARHYQKALNKMLAKHPAERYASVDGLLDDLYFAE
ncbi:MAG: serine/threonine-protein kinase [Thiotrichaceae bacterium]